MGDQISDSVCVFVYCLHVHVLWAWACVRACVSVCVCVTSTVDNFYVCIACLCPSMWDWELLVSPGVFLILWMSACVRVWWHSLQLSVCTTPGITMVYYCVLMHGRYGESVSGVCVCVCVFKLSASTVGVSDAQLASTGDVAQCTRCTFSSSGYLVFLFMISLSVHVRNLLLYETALLCFSVQWGFMIFGFCFFSTLVLIVET